MRSFGKTKKMEVLEQINQRKKEGKKSFAVLIDPDKCDKEALSRLITKSNDAGVDFFFVGGSLITNNNLESCVSTLKSESDIPVILFPGNTLQVDKNADAILLLSVISGRNPEMLIGRHVISAPMLKSSGLDIIPTGYTLIESGKATSASYMSNTTPIPHDKNDIAVCTAMAGEMLGLKVIFMDGGSGAHQSISNDMVRAVSQNIDIPLIIGGGIRTAEMALEKCEAGADVVVIGNAIEKEPTLIQEVTNAIHRYSAPQD
jgi:phosphoglycerol geranylgeranyltransferase